MAFLARLSASLSLALAMVCANAQLSPLTPPTQQPTQQPTQPTQQPVTTPTTTQATPSAASSVAQPTTSVSAQPAGVAPAIPIVQQPTTLAPSTVTPVPTPLAAPGPIVFGSQMFTGRFAALTYSGFNPEYQLAVGDRVLVRLWGAVTYEATQTVDPQGNIFIPNVGPVRVVAVRNAELNSAVEQQVKRTFRANVGVYATLEAAQPVKIYVTGFVRAPGLYGGLSSDSVLYYLDKAGGIDPERGSYLSVTVQRAGKVRAKIDLYKFLLNGVIDTLQLQDGDTVVVAPRQNTISVFGEALNPYLFEFSTPTISASQLLDLARPRPVATHMSIVRTTGLERRSEYVPLGDAKGVQLNDGDAVTFTADKFPATILVRVDGAQLGERTYVMPYGSRLKDVIVRLRPAPHANMAGLQLFRLSVQQRQKANLDTTLQTLQMVALSSRSATTEEAQLRTQEAALMLQFIDRARSIMPLGQVVLNSRADADEMLLEDGDVLRIPENSSMITVSGEVLFPNSLVFNSSLKAEDYIALVGGYTQRADRDRMVVVKLDGSVAPEGATLQPGDQIMILPRVETKWVELARAVTGVLYQLAVAARVLTTF